MISNLHDILREHIALGHNIEKELQAIDSKNIKGFSKLQARVRSDIKFLEKIGTGGKLKKSNIESSNLKNLSYFVKVLKASQNVTGVLQKFHVNDLKNDIIVVDIVCNYGNTWTKVIARNISGLIEMFKERKSPTTKSLLHIINLYKSAADVNKIHYRSPQIVFNFLTVPEVLAAFILKYDIAIKSEEWIKVDPSKYIIEDDSSDSDCEASLQNLSIKSKNMMSVQIPVESNIVNLDVTALICLVSNLSNGGSCTFKEPVLVKQAEEEIECPVLPPIKEFLKGKKLSVCSTALNAFQTIVDTIGGPAEKQRTKELLEKLEVVADNPSERFKNLYESSKMNKRAKVIFGTGDSRQAVTVTANTGFVRALAQLGINLTVFEHRAIALSESKEIL